jgi:hypothetical protein
MDRVQANLSYITEKNSENGVLDFLEEKKVGRLAFFCLTHPHADHFQGAEKLFDRYRDRIDRLWIWPGLSHRDFQAKILMAVEARAQLTNDFLRQMGHTGHCPETDDLINGFRKVIGAIEATRHKTAFRQPNVPPNEALTLIGTESYKIEALRPDPNLVRDIEIQILKEAVRTDGFVALEEDEGSLINSLSIVLQLEFGKARVLLLADAEGADEVLPHGGYC